MAFLYKGCIIWMKLDKKLPTTRVGKKGVNRVKQKPLFLNGKLILQDIF